MNHKRSIAPFCGALMLLALPAGAQAPAGEVILPGDARIDGSIIHAASNVWKMTGMTPGGNRTDGGLWKDKIEIIDRDGRAVIRRTQIDAGPDGTTTFITEADRLKLTPIRAEVTTAAGFHRVLTFEPGRVHSVIDEPSKAGGNPHMREGDIAIAQRVFDFNGGMFGLLVVGFPLQKDFSASFPVFDPRKGVVWAKYTVIGQERVRAGKGRTIDAWIVEVQDPVRLSRMIFSLTKQPPYIIRLQEISEGKFWTFDMM
jgi:hypothetical protein